MAIVGFAFMMAAPILVRLQSTQSAFEDSSRSVIARDSLNSIEKAASLVSPQDPPARISTQIRIPQGVNNIAFGQNYIILELDLGSSTTDIYQSFDFNISGQIPQEPGHYTIALEAREDHVFINQSKE